MWRKQLLDYLFDLQWWNTMHPGLVHFQQWHSFFFFFCSLSRSVKTPLRNPVRKSRMSERQNTVPRWLRDALRKTFGGIWISGEPETERTAGHLWETDELNSNSRESPPSYRDARFSKRRVLTTEKSPQEKVREFTGAEEEALISGPTHCNWFLIVCDLAVFQFPSNPRLEKQAGHLPFGQSK